MPSVLSRRGLAKAYLGYDKQDKVELGEIEDIEVKSELKGNYGYSEINLDVPTIKKPSLEKPKIEKPISSLRSYGSLPRGL